MKESTGIRIMFNKPMKSGQLYLGIYILNTEFSILNTQY